MHLRSRKEMGTEEWTLVMFDKMQHYLARLCWDNTVATCMAHIPRYVQMLNGFL